MLVNAQVGSPGYNLATGQIYLLFLDAAGRLVSYRAIAAASAFSLTTGDAFGSALAAGASLPARSCTRPIHFL